MPLPDELVRIARAAAAFAGDGEEVAGVLAAETTGAGRAYLVAFAGAAETTTWLVLDEAAEPVATRSAVRSVASIVAMCELAEETAGGGDLDELRSQLMTLRITENPPGIDAAEEAVLALQHALGAPPRVASPAYLDAVGAATRNLELALGESGASPFTSAMKASTPTIDEFVRDVEANYKRELD